MSTAESLANRTLNSPYDPPEGHFELPSLNCARFRPFARPESGKIAVEVINDYGDEVVKVLTV